MKTNFLFPNALKKPSLILWLLSIVGLIFVLNFNDNEAVQLQAKVFALMNDEGFKGPFYFSWATNNILDEITMLLFIVSGLVFAFSKEKVEDEMVAKIRLESLVWATYVNYGVLAFCILFIYGLPFLNVMMYNMFTLLLFFIIRFHWMLYKSTKLANDEE
ncbi:hypothetical protein [Flavobacterium sp.]|uniref:hypothetical protein n=1 Tax=Flavobacterium sp. TaxID=239 RepID=UPI0028BD50A6|nr:hypothetical protein [Flavobacterium sp.]